MALSNFNYSLSWSDFNYISSRAQGQNEDAFIKAEFPYTYELARDKGAIIVPSAGMNIRTIPESCWVVSSEATNELLIHEQGHYDITALGARELYNKMLTIFAKSEHEVNQEITKENIKIQKKIDDANKRYDAQTDHNKKKQQQLQWDKAISIEKQKPDGKIDNLPG